MRVVQPGITVPTCERDDLHLNPISTFSSEITLRNGSTHHMAERRASLMEPRIESLLDREDSKFTLVTLAAKRAREINDYYNQLGEGLGKIVPPQVTSVSRKPLSIALEEIEVGKIIKADIVEVVEVDPDVETDTPADDAG
jgi:DNA-directed RNA polymerase subunit omega